MILLLDNYDSFTHNLYQLIGGVVANGGVAAHNAVGKNSAIDANNSDVRNTAINANNTVGVNCSVSANIPEIMVIRNDKVTLTEIERLSPTHIIISPGPGKPRNAGICEAAIKHFRGKIPIFGVCLGHQAICEAYGGKVGYARELMHGKQSGITVTDSGGLFRNMGKSFKAARYHSLAAQSPLPPELVVTAISDDGEIMAVEDKEHCVYGVQFHPESVMTPNGETIISNFLGVKS
jgi:anthranilate synthase component 2